MDLTIDILSRKLLPSRSPENHAATEEARMADLPPDSNDDAGDDTATPRWVYVSGIIAIVLVLLFVILHLTGHGLGDHTP
jgi:hypothetical protein